MNPEGVMPVVLILSGATILFAGVFFGLYLSKRSITGSQLLQSPRDPSTRALFHPLQGMNFRDALHFDRATAQLTEKVLSEVNGSALQATPDATVVGLTALDLAQSKDLILAKFPEAAQHLLNDGKAAQLVTKSGDTLLVVMDSKGGQFISQARQVDPAIVVPSQVSDDRPVPHTGRHLI